MPKKKLGHLVSVFVVLHTQRAMALQRLMTELTADKLTCMFIQLHSDFFFCFLFLDL